LTPLYRLRISGVKSEELIQWSILLFFTMPTAPRSYDLIVYGDEVPGILALVSAAREYKRQTGQFLRTLLLIKSSTQAGIGGHLVRGGLAYLDRSNMPNSLRSRQRNATFGYPVAIYQEFLQRSGVVDIALDAKKASTALRAMITEVGADILSQVKIDRVTMNGNRLAGIVLGNGETYQAQQFIDCTVNAELTQAMGVPRVDGFGTFGLPNAELPVTLVVETQGLTAQTLRTVEFAYIKRLTNLQDTEAQRYIAIAAGQNAARIEELRKSLLETNGNPKSLYIGSDHLDVRCRALSILYHAFRGKAMNLSNGMLFDQGNVAILSGDRLSWNALMFAVTGTQANALAKDSKPTAEMLAEVPFLERWFKFLGAKSLVAMPELYIRHAGNVLGALEPLSGAKMMAGGVPENEAIGTFAYHLDVRGGIPGLGNRASEKKIGNISFHEPPAFNIGIRHAILSQVRNVAVLGPGSGFEGYACGAGRIVEFNVGVGQGLGIAAAIAIKSQRVLADISNREVRDCLIQTQKITTIYGVDHPLEAKRLKEFELALMIERMDWSNIALTPPGPGGTGIG
jgi:FAD dependent oxidoreductase